MDPEEIEDQPSVGGDEQALGPESGEHASSFDPADGYEPRGSTPDAYVSRDEYDRALAELEEERGRSRNSQAWAAEANQRIQHESAAAVRRELERMYHEHSSQQQQWAQMQPPAPEGIEEWLVEPQQIAQYVNRYGQWVREATLAQIQPFLQRFALYDAVLPAVLSREAENSVATAKRMLEEEGVTDFDELRGEIEQAFAANPAGARLMLDPATVASVYHFISRQKGTVRPVREKSKPVPSAGTSRPGSAKAPTVALSATMRTVADRLQINPAKLAERLAKRRAS